MENKILDANTQAVLTASSDSVSVVRNYKDTIFRMIFKEKAELLELYNAINDTSYSEPDKLEVTTLENAIYMSMKNDVSCMLDMRLNLYEQQSTVNPNVPLRDLMYVTAQYEKFIINKDLYSSRRIALPTPRFIVFYNGIAKQPERVLMRLSEAFMIKEEEPSMELVVTQLNINEGYNDNLMKKCPTLWQYMSYVNKVRSYRKTMPLEQAVEKTVEECINENILKEFLLKNKAEVVKMSIYEYDEELHRKTLYDEGHEDGYNMGREDGYNIGHESGYTEGDYQRQLKVVHNMKKENMSIELISKITGLTQEEIEKL